MTDVLSQRFRIVALESVDSTNAEARRFAQNGAPDGTIVWAGRQVDGRGRRGRSWSSPPGNLYCSLLLRPACAPADAAQIGFVTGLAVAEAIAEALGRALAVTCKWPNDVLVAGHKVAGILLESAMREAGTVDWVIVGIGVNVDWFPAQDDGAYPAASLASSGARNVTPRALLDGIAARMEACGVHCVLVGESLMREADVETATRRLLTPAVAGRSGH